MVALWCLDDEERRAGLRRAGEQLRSAVLFNLAMHDGKALDREVKKHERSLHAASCGTLISDDPVIRQALSDALAGLKASGRLQ